MFDKSMLRNSNNMGLKVKQHPRKLLYYARVDNRNPQTVGHMCEGESQGEGRGWASWRKNLLWTHRQ